MPGKTTRGFRPGPIRPGRWFAELGARRDRRPRRSATPTTASPGGSRSSTPATRRSPTSPTARRRYPRQAQAQRRPAGTRATCTSTPSTPRSATRRCARRSTTRSGRAKLDFITLTDYVTDSAWGEIGRYRTGRHLVGALLGGHHLPRAHQQPALRPLRRLPHRPGLRPARRRRRGAAPRRRSPRAGSCATSAAPAASRRSTTRRSSRRPTRCSRCCAAAARGTTPRAGDELPLRRRDRGQHGPAEDRRGAEPVHQPPRSTSTRQALARGAHAAALGVSDSHNAGRTHGGPTPVAGRRRRDRRVREAAVRARAPLRGQGRPHVREDRRPDGPDLRFTGRVPGAPARARSSATRPAGAG